MEQNQNLRDSLQRKVTSCRGNLLAVVIFTAVNLALLLMDTGSYFLFSASGPYYLTAFGMGMDMGMLQSGYDNGNMFTIIALVIAALVLGLLLLCWGLSKKRGGWLIVALVVMILDSLVLAAVAFLMMDAVKESIMDFLFHGWVLVSLCSGISANSKLKKLPPEEPAPALQSNIDQVLEQ